MTYRYASNNNYDIFFILATLWSWLFFPSIIELLERNKQITNLINYKSCSIFVYFFKCI